MRVIRKFALLLAVALSLCAVSALAATDMYVDYCDEWVSLREQPSTSSDRLAKVPKGESVFGLYRDGDFWYCEYNGMFGYILAKYLVEMEFDSDFGSYDPGDSVVNDGWDVASEGDTVFGDSAVSGGMYGNSAPSSYSDTEGYKYPLETKNTGGEHVGYFYVDDSEIPVYAGPGLSTKHITYLQKGVKVSAYAYSDNFYYCYVVDGEVSGYMHKADLTKYRFGDDGSSNIFNILFGWIG